MIERLLKISCVALFLGRAYQYLFIDAPYRNLLWDEAIMSPIVRCFGASWGDYVNNPNTEKYISFLIQSTGFLFFLAAIACFFYQKLPKITRIILFFATINLWLFAFLTTKDSFFQLGQWLEQSIQVSLPLFFFYWKKIEEKFSLLAKIIVAVTFAAHGLYVIGFYPIPVDFVSMTMHGFSMEQASAMRFLWWIGVFDILAACLVFFPKTSNIALLYMIIWGSLTAFARLYAHWYTDFWQETLHQYGYQVLVRMGHFLLPLAIFILAKTEKLLK